MANTKLSQAAPGTVVKINESGAPVEFLVLQQGYPVADNGNTLLLRKDCYDNRAWGANNNHWDANSIDLWLNTDYLALIEESVRSQIPEIAMPYVPGNGDYTTSTIQRKVGLLTATEVGLSGQYIPVCGTPISYFDSDLKRIAYYGGAAYNWWLMTPSSYNAGRAWGVNTSGAALAGNVGDDIASQYGSRPKFCLVGASWEITGDGTLVKAAQGANTPLSQMAAGSVVKAYEDGIVTEFYIDTQNYESALNGNDFVLLTRKDCYDKRAWDAGNVNTYADSDLDAFLNGDYKMLLEENVRNAIVPTKFYYTPGNMNNTVTTLERDVFELSATELGMSQAYVNVEGSVLPIAETLKIAYLNKTASTQWTRSPSTNLTSHAWYLKADGGLDNAGGTANLCGSRPSFCLLGANMYVDSDGFLTNDPGAGQMFIPADKLEQGVEYYFRVFPRNHQNQFQTGIDGSVVTAIPGSAKVMTAVIDLNDSNPATCVSYADDAANMTPGSAAWDEFFGHYPCLFKDGAEVGKLNPNDFSKFADGTDADIASGAAGDVMIAFPRRGLKITTSGTTLTVSMTNGAAEDGFSYLAHQRGETDKDVFYLGAYKAYTAEGLLRSLSGKTPTVSTGIGSFRTLAQAQGTGYEQSAFYQLLFRQAMYILKYKNLNSQQAVGRGYVDANSAAVATGSTNTKGMDWGETTGKQQMKLFGLEDFWGNVYEWVDGFVNQNLTILTATGNFNDTGSGYTNQGQLASAAVSGFMQTPQGTTQTGFIGKTAGGSSSTYFCDDVIYSAGVYVPQFGGSYLVGDAAGAFMLYATNTTSYTHPTLSARLMYL